MVTLARPFARADTTRWPDPWTLAVLAIAVVFLAPILAVFAAAAGDSGGLWSHLFQTVLPRYVANTLILMAGVAAVTAVFGVASAWTVVRYDFPARRIIEWMLLLPFAVPAYLTAYAYTDFLEYAGPVQGALRELFGWQSASDYWFPEIRSMTGAVLIIGSVLYPYVYVMSRVAFMLTPASLFEIGVLARRGVFWSIALPLARPGILTGAVLGFAHTVGEFGVVLMIGGNIPGETQVLSIALYDRVESLEYAAAHQLAAGLMIASVLLLAAVYRFGGQGLWARSGER